MNFDVSLADTFPSVLSKFLPHEKFIPNQPLYIPPIESFSSKSDTSSFVSTIQSFCAIPLYAN